MGASKLVGVWASLALTLVTSAGASAQSPVTWSDAGSFSPRFVTTGLALADVTGSPLFGGLIKTSILAPGPALVVLDGMGLFGPPIPSIVANPGFPLSFGLPPSVAGLAIVLQAYGLDAAYMPDLTQAIFVSNAVPRTL